MAAGVTGTAAVGARARQLAGWVRRWYGASPLHLLTLLACFGLAGYAASQLLSSHPVAVAVWFLGAVIGHDLVLMPLYSVADRSVLEVIRHREPELAPGPWINYLRVPAALSGLLLLVWFPLILRLPSPYHASTALSADPYVWHWLAVTGALFLLSAVAFAVRLRREARRAARAAAAERAAAADRAAAEQAAARAAAAREAAAAERAVAQDEGEPEKEGG